MTNKSLYNIIIGQLRCFTNISLRQIGCFIQLGCLYKYDV